MGRNVVSRQRSRPQSGLLFIETGININAKAPEEPPAAKRARKFLPFEHQEAPPGLCICTTVFSYKQDAPLGHGDGCPPQRPHHRTSGSQTDISPCPLFPQA